MPYFSRQELIGKVYYALVNLTLYRSVEVPNAFTRAMRKGERLGTYTGRFYESSASLTRTWWELLHADGQYYFVRGDQTSPVPLTGAGTVAKRLVRTVVAKVVRRKVGTAQPRPVANGDGAAVLRNILENDKQTHGHLVEAYYHRAVATRAGVADDPQLAAQLAAVAASYEARQQKVRRSRAVKVTTGVSATVQGWLDKLKSMMGLSGIGVLPVLTLPIALAVLVGAGAVGILWLLLRQDEPKAVADVKKAFQLSQAYATMSPEQQQASDTAVEDAARGGVQEGEQNESNSLTSIIKNNVLLIGGALLLFNYAGKSRR